MKQDKEQTETFSRYELYKQIDDLIEKEKNCFQNLKHHSFFIEEFISKQLHLQDMDNLRKEKDEEIKELKQKLKDGGLI